MRSVCRCSMGLASCQALATALETPFVALQVRSAFDLPVLGAALFPLERFCAPLWTPPELSLGAFFRLDRSPTRRLHYRTAGGVHL